MNDTYINTVSLLSKKLIVAISTSALFAMLYALIYTTPTAQQEPNAYYFGFFDLFIFVIVYTMPIYIVLAIPFSILLDKYCKTASLSQFTKGIFYVFVGTIIGGCFYFFLLNSSEIDWLLLALFSLYGLINASFFHLFSMLLDKRYNRIA